MPALGSGRGESWRAATCSLFESLQLSTISARSGSNHCNCRRSRFESTRRSSSKRLDEALRRNATKKVDEEARRRNSTKKLDEETLRRNSTKKLDEETRRRKSTKQLDEETRRRNSTNQLSSKPQTSGQLSVTVSHEFNLVYI